MARLVQLRGEKAIPLSPDQFLAESDLQLLLECYPELLTFDELDNAATLLIPIGYEVRLAGQSLDLLFIDLSGRLTAIETKLRRNHEIRRTVVGQILEYGASLADWTADDVQRQASDYFRSERIPARFRGKDLVTVLSEASGAESPEAFDLDEFWTRAAAHLRGGSIRLVIAVDRIVDSLRRTVSFTNRGTAFDVYLLEVQEYGSSDGSRFASLSLYGTAERSPTVEPSPRWTGPRFMEALESMAPRSVPVMRELFDFLEEHADHVRWGTGSTFGGAGFGVRSTAGTAVLFWLDTRGQIGIGSAAINKHPQSEERERFVAALASLGLSRTEKLRERDQWLYFSAESLREPERLTTFEQAVMRLKDTFGQES